MVAASAMAIDALTIATITRVRRRSIRSTRVPIAIAKSNQGRRYIAPETAINTGSSVSETASNGAAAAIRPSPRFDEEKANHRRLKAGPKDLVVDTDLLNNPSLKQSAPLISQ